MSFLDNAKEQINDQSADRVRLVFEKVVFGQLQSVELPFVLGIIADLNGNICDEIIPVENRKFEDIDANSFEQFLGTIKPRLSY